MMKLKIPIGIILFIPTILLGQIEETTLDFKGISIKCYRFKLENDTLSIAYFDKSVRVTNKSIHSNLGEMNMDATFDSIVDFVRNKFPNERPRIIKTDTKVELINFGENISPPAETMGLAHNHFWIGSINYYGDLIKNGKLTDSNYYNLANSLIKYHGSTNPWGINQRVISYLDSCISLNQAFLKAYLLKAKIQVQNAIWEGILSSDPHVDVINPIELNKATATLRILFQYDDANKEAYGILDEINELKKKYNQYTYD